MNTICCTFSLLLFLFAGYNSSLAQQLIQEYEPLKKDSIRVGTGDEDFLPLIQKGYTLMLPTDKTVKGVLILLEDSGYDEKNRNAKQLYEHASEKGFAVLSVSTEIPFDFYFSEASMQTSHDILKEAFAKHKLPNEQVFFLGASLVGHRAMRYIKYMKEKEFNFQLNIKGMVLCNFTMDFTRKWYQHTRDIRINKINLWEPTFINYLLETHLGGTPETHPAQYHDFSAYSYSDAQNRNIALYKDYAIRAYIEPAIEYKLERQLRTLYENNATDMVGFLAELQLVGNEKTQLIVIQPKEDASQPKNTQSTWDGIDKEEMVEWIWQQIHK